MQSRAGDTTLPLLERLWIYQAERFPLFRTALLLAAFSAASLNVSAFLAGRPLPSAWPYVAIWLVLLVVFFQMRAADEWKDLETDRRYRPERPIPRGLVTLRGVVTLALGLVPIALALAASVAPQLVLLLCLVWLWLAAMTVEFGMPDWLKARPIVYLASHMLIMPLIDLFVTGAEWLPAGGYPPDGLWLFLALSFVNGCVLEIGRKIYAPASERAGVETYTAAWGLQTAVWVWSGCLVLSCALLVMLGVRLGVGAGIALVTGIALVVALAVAWTFMRSPTPARQKAIDTLAGLWVLACYGLAGGLPLMRGAVP
ncbi:MAG: UbiA family prenyltransferase [Hyphomicrobiaceae bacterium]|nr:UbiA family prenyltransferase [Hyphomicrobiaceae bacterium]